MKIFIDADACPKPVKEVLYRAAIRTNTELILVANQYMQIPRSHLIRIIQVNAGFDEADKRIVQEVNSGDIVITADIPLAALVVERGALALNPRGHIYNKENIKQQLAIRDLKEQLRDNLLISGGPRAFSKLDCQSLANKLDSILAKKR